jgi:hypothetical protein
LALLHVASKKVSLIEDRIATEECKVLLQVIIDLLCSLLDFSTHYPSSTPPASLMVGQQVLSALLQMLSSFTYSKEVKHPFGQVLGVCKHVCMKVKAVALMNERSLASNSRFAQVLALCEKFLKYLSHLSKSWRSPIHLSDTFQFSPATLLKMNNHFEQIVVGAAVITPNHDVEYDHHHADAELVYELQRLRNNSR